MTVDWIEISQTLERDLFFSTRKCRLEALHQVETHVSSITDAADPSIGAIQEMILMHYDHLGDTDSRLLATRILTNTINIKKESLKTIIKVLTKLTSKHKSVALSNMVVVTSFLSSIVETFSSEDVFTQAYPDLVTLFIQIFDIVFCCKSDQDTKHKERIRKSILKSTEKSVSLLSQDQVSTFVNVATTSKSSIESIIASISVLSQNELTEADIKSIVDFFTKTLLATKAPVNNLALLTPFFKKFVTSEVLLNTIVPSLEKAIIRSSETSLSISIDLLESFSSSVDLAEVVSKSKLLSQFVANVKSSKETVRPLAVKNLLIVLKSQTTEESASKVADEVLKTIKTISAADQKALGYSVLAAVPPSTSVSTKISDAIAPLILKDQNEISLDASLNAYFAHLIALVNSGAAPKDAQATVTKGFKDAKIQLRRLWFSNFGSHFENAELTENLISFASELLPSMTTGFDDIIANPTNNIKGIVVPYVTLIVSDLVKSPSASDLFCKALSNSEKQPSILQSARVYSKLSTPDEKTWFVKALSASTKYVTEASEALGNAWIAFILSRLSSSQLTRLNIEKLAEAYTINQSIIGASLISASESTLLNKAQSDDTNLEPVYSRLSSTFHAFSQGNKSLDKELLTEHLSRIIITAHHQDLAKVSSWISLVLKAEVDPGYVAKEYHAQIIDTISKTLVNADDKIHNSGVFTAACDAASTMAFIDPTAVGPLLKNLFETDLSSASLTSISATDIEIWRGTEGEMVVNVLDSKKKAIDNKNSKDYETRKWEESVRKEVAKKNVGNKKYTKEELELVNAQLSKESEIRKRVSLVHSKLRRSIGLVNSLAEAGDAIDNGKTYWFAAATNGLLDVLAIPSTTEIVGELAIRAFLDLSKVVSARLTFRHLIGVATLVINKINAFEYNVQEDAVSGLISSVLFRIKFVASERPCDFISLMYMLPLLSRVLEQGKAASIKNAKKPVSKSEFVEEDPEEEQLMLALEIISAHAELFKNPAIPREQIINVLLSLLALPAKAKLAKECLLTLCQYISIDFSNDDLKLLFAGLLSQDVFVRNTILEALDQEFDLSELTFSNEIWIACHDNESTNAELAAAIWEENGFTLTEEDVKSFYHYLDHTDSGIRLSVAKAIAEAVQVVAAEPEKFARVLNELLDVYREMARPPEPILDEFGLVVKSSQDQKDKWEARSGVAITLKFLNNLFADKSLVAQLIEFMIDEKALGDKEPIVAEEFKEAAIAVIDAHGAENVETLIPVFEKALASQTTDKVDEMVRENVVVLYGSLAKHLSSTDPRLSTIVERLIKTLVTPSEKVQSAIAEVIAPLVPLFRNKVGAYIETLFTQMFQAQSSSRRRGLAYGIAGLTKGYGIAALSEFDIIRTLTDAAEDKKDAKRRESSFVAFECLARCLGKFFEPYVIEILPIILKGLGDATAEVRDATAEASKMIMQNTTSYGVKKLIPVAIENLEEISWRSKKGSVDLLGSMAYLDPTQLSASLSTIVPEIVGVLNDSHKEVRKAADQSLQRFGEVIRNPEIQKLVPTLIRAIGDPTKHTEEALDALIQTQFVHYIDGPSLALIIHVIHRGMHDRSAQTKRKACQIVGNMAILVDSRDLLPYLHQLVSELEIAMVDPVPNTRATAARALGALVEKLGEEQFPELIPRLLDTLYDETKAGDRLGSAQALSEVISGIGIRKLEELLPTILKGSTSPRATVREGFLPLLLFLPVCFGSQFAPYISQIIPAILNGLADTDESIRGTALKAGRLLVKNYASKAIDLLLPELESGLLDTNHRIRLSSVELIGDLLFQVTGISGKNELNEEDNDFSGTINKRLVGTLGPERRDRVLSLLFICRSDTAVVVRNAAIDIWKSLVANTPRTIKEILPSLTNIIIRRLANADEGQRTIAAQTLGELVRRVGGNALGQLLPTLQDALGSSDGDSKQGICIAVRELIDSSNDHVVLEYQEIFVDIIRSTLIDPSPSVRESSAHAFDVFQNRVGKIAVDEVIPYLLNMLQTPESDNALSALQEIMTTKSEVIFPILIPTLLATPIDSFRARALGSFAEVAGKALLKRLSTVINALVNELVSDNLDKETSDDLKSAFDKILLSVDDDEGVHPLMLQLASFIKGDNPKKRAVIYERLGPFFTATKLDYYQYTTDFVQECIMALDDKDPEVVKNAVVALTALVKQQDKETLERLVKPAKQALEMTGVTGEDLAGFTLPKGANCVLPIFLHGLMYGSTDQREAAALAIADVVSKTPATSLKALVTVITGPLIRVIGERFPSDLKAAILYALNMIFEKIPQFLRPFIPQLQRTFVKSLSDAGNETLRLRAAKALGTLIEYQPRVDPLVSELVTGAKSAETTGVKTAMLKALLEVITKAGDKLSQASKSSILDLVESEILEVDDKLAVAYARLVGSLSRILKSDEAAQILKQKVIDTPLQGDDSSKFAILTLNAFLKDAPQHIFNNGGLLSQIVSCLVDGSNATTPYISDNATVAIGKLLLLQGETTSVDGKTCTDEPFDIPFPQLSELVSQIAHTCVKPVSNSLDTRRLSLVVVRTVAQVKKDLLKAHWDVLGPAVFACVRDAVIPIKLAAEKAYLALFDLVDDVKMVEFNKWFEAVSAKGEPLDAGNGQKIELRSIGDYTKRVGARLAGVQRERVEAGGDDETVFSDRIEDMNEIWAVGGVDLTKV
ncbi:Translational activator GCN1 [Cyberlindnera fabianii]|uniref:eIF-2-alpha kinase activator GCN1 n=1 Tax=Cyberlindnera fabianii TaxID=36022 RepID=A0A1V2LD77_CYBFA|nr:Translational activator GCN1 [Cyberlindnera fabianii]